jgi:hypothetical protein
MPQIAEIMTDMIAEVADHVRLNDSNVDDAVREIASDYQSFGHDVKPDVLLARVNRAYPDGIPGAMPSEEEMRKRRAQHIAAGRQAAIDEMDAIDAFFKSHPGLLRDVRRNIERFTGMRSCSMYTAKKIGDFLLNEKGN